MLPIINIKYKHIVVQATKYIQLYEFQFNLGTLIEDQQSNPKDYNYILTRFMNELTVTDKSSNISYKIDHHLQYKPESFNEIVSYLKKCIDEYKEVRKTKVISNEEWIHKSIKHKTFKFKISSNYYIQIAYDFVLFEDKQLIKIIELKGTRLANYPKFDNNYKLYLSKDDQDIETLCYDYPVYNINNKLLLKQNELMTLNGLEKIFEEIELKILKYIN